MIKKFVVNFSFSLLINITVKPLWLFLVDRSVQNSYPEAYGKYFAIYNFTFLLVMIADFGLNNYNTNTLAQSNKFISKHFNGIASLKFFLALLYLSITLIFGLMLGFGNQTIYLLMFLSGMQFFIALNAFLRSTLSGLHKYKTEAFVASLDKLLALIIVFLCFLYSGNWASLSLTLFAGIQFIASIGTFLLLFILLKPYLTEFKLVLDWQKLLYFFKKGLPYALLALTMAFYTRIDAILLDKLAGSYHSSVYGTAYRLLDAANFTGISLSVILLPMMGKWRVDYLQLRKLLRFTGLAVLLGSTLFALLVWVFKTDIVKVLYQNGFTDLIYLESNMAVLVFAFVPISIIYVFGTFLTAQGKLGFLNTLAAVALVVNVVLNLSLIPAHLAVGCAISTVVTQGVMALGCVVKSIFEMRKLAHA